MPIIVALVIVVLCSAGYLYIKRTEMKKKQAKEDEENIYKQTAQEFINAKDIGESCLYTIDGNVFAYVKIEGICLELFTDSELKNIIKSCSAGLSKYRHDWKYIAVSRPVDISMTLRNYNNMYSTAEGGRRKLLRMDMEELASMVMTGETLERQHYIAIWGKMSQESDKEVVKRAFELKKILDDNKLPSQVLDKSGIVKLCDLINNPAYVHIENTSDLETTLTVLQGT